MSITIVALGQHENAPIREGVRAFASISATTTLGKTLVEVCDFLRERATETTAIERRKAFKQQSFNLVRAFLNFCTYWSGRSIHAKSNLAATHTTRRSNPRW
jgi:hypothetical protein